MSVPLLRRVSQDESHLRRAPAFDSKTFREAFAIVEDVRRHGETALFKYARHFGEVTPNAAPEALVIPRARLEAAWQALPEDQQALLARTTQRIRRFAEAQRECLLDGEVEIPGGAAGHRFVPLRRAGCYAPGGRYPLPSTVLMTAVTARVAGVAEVWLASPRPANITLAAAAIAGADHVLSAGGAHAIGALAYGAGRVPACDIVVGPGNRWVTAAKYAISADVAIDMLAGPSEVVVLMDESADMGCVAADLLAQAEHDPDATPGLVVVCPADEFERVAAGVERELENQLADLPTALTARAALQNGFVVQVGDVASAAAICDQLAPEHLELHMRDAATVTAAFHNYGSLFIGNHSAEVFADYGAAPNHVLPTGGTARYSAGLSVLTFLRPRTWLRIDDIAGAADLARDAAALARLEGLEAHARAAERRLPRA